LSHYIMLLFHYQITLQMLIVSVEFSSNLVYE
jgi:hypothetical protein